MINYWWEGTDWKNITIGDGSTEGEMMLRTSLDLQISYKR